MIRNIFIKNIVLIEKLTLDLESGLIIFSGETGAGKSIILTSLGLALGRRSEQNLIRSSAQEGSVSIEIEIRKDHPHYQELKNSNLIEDDVLILRRVINKTGKNKAFINDRPVTLSYLKEVGSKLVEIHGQNEKIGLLDPSSHIEILDDFGNYGNLITKTKEAFQKFQKIKEIYLEAKKIKENKITYEEEIKNKINLIKSLNLKDREEEELSSRKVMLNHYEKIFLSINEVFNILNEEESGYSNLASHYTKLENVLSDSGSIIEIKSIVASLNIILIETKEILNNINKLRENFQYDEKELEKLEHRLFDINNITRKLQTKPSQLNDLLEKLEKELALINENIDNIEKISIKLEETKKIFRNYCKDLTEKRKSTALILEDLVNKELCPLKLEDAKFRVKILIKKEKDWNSQGANDASFFVTLNKGANEGEIHKTSSGGELSRLMLALNLVLIGSLGNKTLIFDEVDSGVSGAVADAIGKRLQQLSKHQQVMVITHLPQVASRGMHHYRSFKRTTEEKTLTYVEKLTSEDRTIEIAKMISGEKVTEEAKLAANKLIRELKSSK